MSSVGKICGSAAKRDFVRKSRFQNCSNELLILQSHFQGFIDIQGIFSTARSKFIYKKPHLERAYEAKTFIQLFRASNIALHDGMRRIFICSLESRKLAHQITQDSQKM